MNEPQRLGITDLILPITDHTSPITHYNRNIKSGMLSSSKLISARSKTFRP
ncbi:hypothetical protein C5S29_10055 [ANME-1 cluster archaeon GoMg3.2]|nr:hypothetical protein [ANME-1 cluster archaeon GoMg3.2]